MAAASWLTRASPRRGSGPARSRSRSPPAPPACGPHIRRGMPAVRVGGHPRDLTVQRHRLQGAASVPRVPGAVRARQGDLSVPPAVFYPLTVSAVDRLAADAAALTFAVPPGLREEFAFRPGQSLTLRRGDERRSYSICVPPGRAPRIGVREVADGVVSGWLV